MDAAPLAYDISAACAALAIGRSKLYELIAVGALDARKLGPKKVVITAESVSAYLDTLPRAEVRIPAKLRRRLEEARQQQQK